MERQNCTHQAKETVVLFISWCQRDSGWRVVRASSRPDSLSGPGSVEVYESHFLPQEETSPDELQHLIQRAFRCAQEWEQDARGV